MVGCTASQSDYVSHIHQPPSLAKTPQEPVFRPLSQNLAKSSLALIRFLLHLPAPRIRVTALISPPPVTKHVFLLVRVSAYSKKNCRLLVPVSDISHVVPCSISEKWNLNGADAVQLLFAILLYFHSEGFAAHLLHIVYCASVKCAVIQVYPILLM